jgi:hypothetical protein
VPSRAVAPMRGWLNPIWVPIRGGRGEILSVARYFQYSAAESAHSWPVNLAARTLGLLLGELMSPMPLPNLLAATTWERARFRGSRNRRKLDNK